ncbi:hypothetical protein EJ05DRAFT_509545 [Pseudovirgaria hyperparasitica]|uniref:3CxxC-type domain-containing protein n=1 Tax=Pseudovirgaria hyperparasitica TaxID=470096 RepID=A0A6A6WB11_9PEZI|nr:uncharacterized protein EJ05DRAFT_509545 [Pseudovirgaria hyperparasitica]KAF2759853.1 hypothetical protein EJ05DRAFT_509545 [Pseudovirgaria hyperparasitica]
MARNKHHRSRGTKATYTFTSLHQNILEAISYDINHAWFCGAKNRQIPENEYQTHVMGKFRCVNVACDATCWSSKKVAILIRGFSNNGYNAEVFGQRCKSCNNLGLLELDEESYVERVAYRVKKWAGVHAERPVYNGKEGPPHERSLCEGCKRGVCRLGD